jgi:hypothetical protein
LLAQTPDVWRLSQLNESVQWAGPRINSSLARAVDDVNPQVGFDADLARQPGIRFKVRFPSQACLLSLSHRRGITGQDLDPARGATRVASATVQDIDSGILDRQDQLLSVLDLERLFTLDCHGGHRLLTPVFHAPV